MSRQPPSESGKRGLLKQLAHSREEFYAEIDDEHLRTCSRCHEVVYPTLTARAGAPTKTPCPFCNRSTRHDPHEQQPLDPPAYLPDEEDYL